jgi:hypothetical protein
LSRNQGSWSAIQTVEEAREAGGRQERRDEGNWALEWGCVVTGGGCVVGVKTGCGEQLRQLISGTQW